MVLLVSFILPLERMEAVNLYTRKYILCCQQLSSSLWNKFPRQRFLSMCLYYVPGTGRKAFNQITNKLQHFFLVLIKRCKFDFQCSWVVYFTNWKAYWIDGSLILVKCSETKQFRENSMSLQIPLQKICFPWFSSDC